MAVAITTSMSIDAMADTRPFDWHYSALDDNTRIDASYRSTQNVRRYFIIRLGSGFHFDRPFMAWIRAHSGATLGEAVLEWQRRRQGK